ncbi:elongation factor 4, partial [Candidatus Roizmanbacteria bacterium]|nr:elongation factor 4 [Candidatus Roizmanbacteria bacterium]
VVEKIPSPVSSFANYTNVILNEAKRSEESPANAESDSANAGSRIRERFLDPASGGARNDNNQIQALIFDSYYDSHRGVIAFVRVFSGVFKKSVRVKLAASNVVFDIHGVGIFTPDLQPADELPNGQIGYVVTNLKDIHQVRVGDTIIGEKSSVSPLPGYRKINPMVYASVFTTDPHDYLNLKKALEKLYLNDSSLDFSPIYSQALGAGFRVGFLGLLHADVVRERLEREFNLSLILTPPQVEYKHENNQFYEPYVKIMIVTPDNYVGNMMQLCENYRARFITMDNKNQTTVTYEMPLSEMVSDFFDNLKSISSGYASLDWEFLQYEPVKADKLEILLNGDPVEEFSQIVVFERADEKARELTSKLREIIPRQQYEVRIQGKYKGKIIASERIAPYRKDVLIKSGKVVGAGDVGRKRKLLEKQKEGKKRMKMVGKVEIPKEAFLQLFKKS